MASDPLIDRLVGELTPVVRPNRARQVALLIGLGVAETGLFLWFYGMRPDAMAAMHHPSMWWKGGSLLLIAALAGAAVLRAQSPGERARPLIAASLWVALAAVLAGWLIDAGAAGTAALIARLDWREGLACTGVVVALAVPAAAVLALLLKRGAPVEPGRAAIAAGLAAAAWGGFVFTFNCPHDDPLYIVVWFGLAVAVITGLCRWVLPQLTRW